MILRVRPKQPDGFAVYMDVKGLHGKEVRPEAGEQQIKSRRSFGVAHHRSSVYCKIKGNAKEAYKCVRLA